MNSHYSPHNTVTEKNRGHKALAGEDKHSVIHGLLLEKLSGPPGSAVHMSGTTDLREGIDPEVIYYLNISLPLIPFISALQVIVQHQKHGSMVKNTTAVRYSKQKQKIRPRHHVEAINRYSYCTLLSDRHRHQRHENDLQLSK